MAHVLISALGLILAMILIYVAWSFVRFHMRTRNEPPRPVDLEEIRRLVEGGRRLEAMKAVQEYIGVSIPESHEIVRRMEAGDWSQFDRGNNE